MLFEFFVEVVKFKQTNKQNVDSTSVLEGKKGVVLELYYGLYSNFSDLKCDVHDRKKVECLECAEVIWETNVRELQWAFKKDSIFIHDMCGHSSGCIHNTLSCHILKK